MFKRYVRVMCMCFLLITLLLPMGRAGAAWQLPASLTALEDEAFTGNWRIEGLISLPGGVTRLGKAVFAGTRLYALEIPAGVKTIPPQELVSAAYVRLASADTQAQPGAFEGVKYVIAPAQSAAGAQAQADGAALIDAQTLREEAGFLFTVAGGEATLLCAADASLMAGEVTVPAALEDGTPVTALSSNAMMRCQNITMLRLPQGIAIAQGALSSCPCAVVMHYSDTALCVTSLRAGETSVPQGTQVSWIAQTNSEGPVTYQYELTCTSSQGSQVVHTVSTGANRFAYTPQEPGSYVLALTCRDASGAQASAEAAPVQVLGPDLRIDSLTCSAQAAREGDDLTWTCTATGGNGPVQYAYTLMHNGTAVAESTTSEGSYTLQQAPAGQYTLTVTASDGVGDPRTMTSPAVTVYTVQQAAPAAPLWQDTPFSLTQDAAPVLTAGDMSITWADVPCAVQYGVKADILTGDTWSIVYHTMLGAGKTACTLPASIFPEEEVLCRVGLYSVNLEEGPIAYYYATVQPRVVDPALTVDGASAHTWYEAYYGACSKTFLVESELPWTVTASTGGDWYSWQIQDNVLTITLEENTRGTYLTDKLTVSNGVNSAKISLRHYSIQGAPMLAASAGRSESNPLHLPMEAFQWDVSTNGADVAMTLYAPEGGSWRKVWYTEDYDPDAFFAPRSLGLTPGVVHRLCLQGYCLSLKDTVQLDPLTTWAYVVFDDAEEYLAFSGGGAAHTITALPAQGSYNVVMHAQGAIPTVSTDAAWMSAGFDESYYESHEDMTLRITCEENTSAQTRTGTVTITCGGKTAVLTVLQPSNLPRLMQPQALSATESSPTTVYLQDDLGYNAFRALCDSLTLEVKANGAYTAVDTDTDEDLCYVEIPCDEAVTGSIYRLTLTRGSTTQLYYVKFASSSYYLWIDNDYAAYHEMPAAGGTATVTLKANGSWTAACADSWLSVSPGSGSASTAGKTITITAQGNQTGETRRSVVTFKRGSYQQVDMIITQPPQAQGLSISWDLMERYGVTGGEGGGSYLYIDTQGAWTATTPDSWLSFNAASSVSSKSGTGRDEFKVYAAPLAAGSAQRTGTVTVTAGSITRTLTLTQLPMLNTPVLSPALSNDEATPSIFVHDNMTLTWKGDPAASYYSLSLRLRNYAGKTTVTEYTIPEDGSATYTFTIPRDWLLAGTDYVNRLVLYSYDQAGIAMSQKLYFQVAQGSGVFVEGVSSKSFNKLSDLGDEESVTVTSTGAWTAHTDDKWLTLNRTSGVSGDVLTITAGQNFGQERTGLVTVQCGTSTARVNIRQYAYIPDAPLLKDCSLSTAMASPAVVDKNTTSITVNWDKERQASYYQIRLYEIHTTHRKQHRHTASEDDTLLHTGKNIKPGDETYTITGLALRPGALYMLDFYRTIPDGRSDIRHYYFMASTDDAPFVTLDDGAMTLTEEYASTEDQFRFTIESNCTWRAETNASWLMVGDESYTQAYLTEEEATPADYAAYTSMGDELMISALANSSGATRTGKVTVTVPGGQQAVITVVQPRNCQAAQLVSPALTDNRTSPVRLPYADVNLSWTKSPDGAGKYAVTLREKLPGETRSYTVFSKTTTGQSMTIPRSKLTENADYTLYLETYADDVCTVCQTYRFHVNYQNNLAVTAQVSWTDESVSVTAQASGGSGTGYAYSFGLRRDGVIIDNTMWHDSLNRFAFQFTGTGTYQVEVVVSDSAGQRDTFIVSEHVVQAQAVKPFVAPSQSAWQAEAQGGRLTLDVHASGEWSAASNAHWLAVEAADAQVTLTAMENPDHTGRSAAVTFTCMGASGTLTVYQPGQQTQPGGDAGTTQDTIALSQDTWRITMDSADFLWATVTSSGPWTAADFPGWISLSELHGTGETRVLLYAFPNTGLSRTGKVVFQCGEASCTLTVTQLGSDAPPEVSSFTMTPANAATGEDITFTVDTTDATHVALVVDGVRYDTYPLTDGEGSFTRAFSQAGARQVQLLPLRLMTEGPLSAAQTLNVTSRGTLAQAVIPTLQTVYQGQDAVITWQSVPKAQGYSLYLYKGGVNVWMKPVDATVTSCTIPAERMPQRGSYTFVLMATATGYTASESSTFVDVVMPPIDFNITSPAARAELSPAKPIDIRVDNPSGRHIAVKLTDASGRVTYLPADGATISDPVIAGKLLYSPTGTGKITAQVMAWPTAVRTSDADAWHDPRRDITFTVTGPVVTGISLGGNQGDTYISQDDLRSMEITTNSLVTQVSFLMDGQPLTVLKDGNEVTTLTAWSSPKADGSRVFSCDTYIPSEGFHDLEIIVSDGAGQSSSVPRRFCAYFPMTPQTIYPLHENVYLRLAPYTADRDATRLALSTPMKLIGRITRTDGRFMYYVRVGESYGLIFTNEYTTSMQLNGDDIVLTPLNTDSWRTYVGARYGVYIQWDCSIDLPYDAKFVVSYKPDGAADYQYVTLYEGRENQRAVLEGFNIPGRGSYTVRIAVEQMGQVRKELLLEGAMQIYQTNDDYINHLATLPTASNIAALAATYLANESALHLSEEMKANWAGWVYSLLFGEKEVAFPTDGAKASHMAALLMDHMAMQYQKPSEFSVSFFIDFFQFCDNFELFNETMNGLFVRLADFNDFGIIPPGMEKVLNLQTKTLRADYMVEFLTDSFPPYTFEELVKKSKWSLYKSGARIAEAIIDGVQSYVQYASVPAQEVIDLANVLMACDDEVLKLTGEKLGKMSSKLGRGKFVAGVTLGEFMETGIDLMQDLALTITGGFKVGISVGTGVSELAFNITDVLATSERGRWSVDAMLAYRTELDSALTRFRYMPRDAYAYTNLVTSLKTYYKFMCAAYEGVILFLEAYDESLVGSFSPEGMRTSYAYAKQDYLRLVKEINDYHELYLEPFGIPRADW